MGRKIAREESMKLLFQMNVNNDFTEEAVDKFIEYNEFKPVEEKYIRETVTYIMNNLEEFDTNIEKYSKGWKLNRIAKVDLAVLRIAIYEILLREDIPVEVSINEAVEISKKYSSDESRKFINGVLGGFVRGMEK